MPVDFQAIDESPDAAEDSYIEPDVNIVQGNRYVI